MSPTARRAVPPLPVAPRLDAPQAEMSVVGVEFGLKMVVRAAVGVGVWSGGEGGGEGVAEVRG